ncbi:MAG: cytochrome c oxidase accessory protein CcoG [Oligoflexia bacterium]|nr:cytochrome c oxidase accessory protein CcoG [Oligoflexia bacterium]
MIERARELPKDRLTTTDEKGRRLTLYPTEARGRFRALRSRFYDVLLVVFLALPWLRIGGHQAVLLDLPRRRFSFFGLTFWAHDAPMLFFVLGGFVLALVFVTAVWGRVWCGWACPQTVFIDGVFRRLERWIEGTSSERRRLDGAPWTMAKMVKKSAKWAAFGLASLVISHSFLAYFVGTAELARMIATSPLENPASFLVMAVTAGVVLFDFGWFREQFCTIACPYGRFQSVLMDDDSLIVGYDARRGEPRKGAAIPMGGPRGDCVNCNRCVQVCPTGIDIRRGLQLECIACTACIDACDDMMARMKRPAGLIRYSSLAELEGGKRRRFSARAAAYLALLGLFGAGLTYTILRREPLDYTVLRSIGAPYEVVGDSVINHFRIDLSNQSFEELSVRLEGDRELVLQLNPLTVPAGESRRVDFFVRLPKSEVKGGRAELKLRIHAQGGRIQARFDEGVRLVGPYL